MDPLGEDFSFAIHGHPCGVFVGEGRGTESRGVVETPRRSAEHMFLGGINFSVSLLTNPRDASIF